MAVPIRLAGHYEQLLTEIQLDVGAEYPEEPALAAMGYALVMLQPLCSLTLPRDRLVTSTCPTLGPLQGFNHPLQVYVRFILGVCLYKMMLTCVDLPLL